MPETFTPPAGTLTPQEHVGVPPVAVAAGDEVRDARHAELLGQLGHLRECATRHARQRRLQGMPIAGVTAEVRQLVREAAAGESWRDASDVLTADVVRWSVGAYHDGPESRHGPADC